LFHQAGTTEYGIPVATGEIRADQQATAVKGMVTREGRDPWDSKLQLSEGVPTFPDLAAIPNDSLSFRDKKAAERQHQYHTLRRGIKS
jgi:hypothetical protein